VSEETIKWSDGDPFFRCLELRFYIAISSVARGKHYHNRIFACTSVACTVEVWDPHLRRRAVCLQYFWDPFCWKETRFVFCVRQIFQWLDVVTPCFFFFVLVDSLSVYRYFGDLFQAHLLFWTRFFPIIVVLFIFFYPVNKNIFSSLYCSCLSRWKTIRFVFWTISLRSVATFPVLLNNTIHICGANKQQ